MDRAQVLGGGVIAAHRPGRGEAGGLLPAPGALFWTTTVACVTATWGLRTAYFYLDDVISGHRGTLPQRVMAEGTGALGALLLIPLIVWTFRRFTPVRAGWPAAIAAHLATFGLFSATHTLFMASTRQLLSRMFALGPYDYGPLRIRLLMEAPSDATTYAVIIGALMLAENVRARRERERHALELESEIAQARLANLQLQLQPHFLFNALNTISATMYDDPAAADTMIGRVSDLLRHALGTADCSEMPLGDELRLLESYVALVRARFGERVDVTLEIAPGLEHALVPPLMLQPLVENAFQHGVFPAERGRVVITVRTVGDTLECAVENDHAQDGTSRAGSGLGMGLAVTKRRLALLYGDAGSIAAAPTGGDRYRVQVSLPLRFTTGAAPAVGGVSIPPAAVALRSAAPIGRH